jgi:CMP-N-acetylneuraminic acid synthetase
MPRNHLRKLMSYKSRTIIALVPARGGSKGIERKNLAPAGGHPLVWHTLNAAKNTPGIDEVWISSDDDEILRVGSDANVNALKRPIELANDESSAESVVWHFFDSLRPEIFVRDPIIVYLQPTSPLRTEHHIEEALALMQRSRAASVISVVKQVHSPFKCFTLDSQGRLQSLFKEKLSNARRQDLPSTYLPNGAIYAFFASEFKARRGFPSNGAVPYVMAEIDSIDVDSRYDLALVDKILTEKKVCRNSE